MHTRTDHTEQRSGRVGKFTFEVADAPADEGAQTSDRWARRSEALAAWLLAQWEREQRQRMAQRN